jgi:pyruvate-formate lyase-activating enzyme
MRVRRKKFAILQLIPKHQNMLPNQLVRALSLLKYHQVEYAVYDLEASLEAEAGQAVASLFAKIREDEVVVSLACHYNYPKLTSLVLLFMYQGLLKGKQIHVCSPYLSFYPVKQICCENMFFHFVEIDEFLVSYSGWPFVAEGLLLKPMAEVLRDQNYTNREFWTHLTWGCRSSCSFCHNWATAKGRERLVYSGYDEVLSLMQTARALGARKFQFADPDFLGDAAYVGGFLEKLTEAGGFLPWRAKARLDRINESMYEKMLAAGCDRIFFGVEHVSSRMLDRVNKGENTPRLLLDFIKYWGTRVQLDVSFLTGIREETVSELRENIRYISRIDKIRGIEAYLGYVILYSGSARKVAFSDYLVAFLLVCNMLPEEWEIGQDFLRRLLQLCQQEPFFGFFILTENDHSLALFQELLRQNKADIAPDFLSDFARLWTSVDGRLAKIVAGSKTTGEVNQKIDQWLLK